MKSVWEKLAEMTEEKRQNYVKLAKKEAKLAKTTQIKIGGVVYSEKEYSIPDALFFDAEFDAVG